MTTEKNHRDPLGQPGESVRRKTRAVRVGNRTVGGGAPVSIQSMTNTPAEDLEAIFRQVQRLCAAGCDIVRLAVPKK